MVKKSACIGIVHKKLSFRSHILDSNEVWFTRFWLEGSMLPRTQYFAVGFVSRDFDSQCAKDLDSRRHGPQVAAGP